MCATAAHAQTSDQPAAEPDEIIVTATKRATLLSDVPIAITAFTGETLEKRGIDDFEGFARFTPGLDFQKSGAARTQYVIRGLSVGRVTTAEPQNRSLVAVYFEDVPIQTNGLNPDIDLFDVERVEILKGPQGTLFGDSAMAGAIRYVAQQPNLKQVEGKASTSLSSTHRGGMNYTAKGAINLPIVEDQLGLRVSGSYRHNSGYVDNILTGKHNVNDDDTVAVRGSLLWKPGSNFSAQLFGTYQHTGAGGESIEEGGVGPDGRPRPGLGSFAFSRMTDESLKDDFLLGVLTLNYDVGLGNITSVSSYHRRKLTNVSTDFPEDVFPAFGLAVLPNNKLVQPLSNKQFTQEIRFASTLEGRFNFTVGAYYADQNLFQDNLGTATGFDAYILANNPFGIAPDQASFDALGCAALTDTWFCGGERNKVKQYAAFGEAYVEIVKGLTLTLGGRYFKYDQQFDQRFAGWFNFGDFPKVRKNKDDGFNPKVNLSYKPNRDTLVYASATKGFRLGGVSNSLPSFCSADLAALGFTANDVDTFKPDTLWTYEVGSKLGGLAGRRLSIEASAFYTDWKNIQTPINLACGYIPTFNASKLRVFGAEVQASFRFSRALSGTFSVTHTDASLVGDAPALSATDGSRAPYTPRWTLSSYLTYETPGEGFGYIGSVGAKYQSNAYDTFNRQNELPSQFVVNARAGIRFDRLRVTAFADNLTDETIVTNARTRYGEVKRYLGRPRTIGVELSTNF